VAVVSRHNIPVLMHPQQSNPVVQTANSSATEPECVLRRHRFVPRGCRHQQENSVGPSEQTQHSNVGISLKSPGFAAQPRLDLASRGLVHGSIVRSYH